MTRLQLFIEQCERPGFYGEVVLRFKDGKVGKVTVARDYLEDTLPISGGRAPLHGEARRQALEQRRPLNEVNGTDWMK